MANRYSSVIKLAGGLALVTAVLILHPGSWEERADAQGKGGRADPLLGTRFQVEAEGLFKAYFSACSGIGSTSEVIEHKIMEKGGKEPLIRKIPGRVQWKDVTLARGMTTDMSLSAWRQDIIDGKIDQARKKCTITMFDQTGRAVAAWELLNAWPAGLVVNQKADGEQVVEEMTITCESAVRKQ